MNRVAARALELALTPLGWLLRVHRADATQSIACVPALSGADGMSLSSPAFGQGGIIPAVHCGFGIGRNLSPALTWSYLPPGTRQLLLIVEDFDSPTKAPAIHMVALFAPRAGGIAEGALTADNPAIAYFPDRRGRTGYIGPRPLPGHGVHRYRFLLYAIDTWIEAAASDVRATMTQLTGHVLAGATLEGVRSS